MISKATFSFLEDLKHNNDRTWFNANKRRYETARAEFESFIEDLIPRIARFDPSIVMLDAKSTIFRIYRDTRFSKDKSPYKTNFGAHLLRRQARPHDRAGYYIHVEPGNCFLAGGAYLPPAPWLRAIRNAIDEHGQKLIKILETPQFKQYFGGLEGEQLKKTPRDYPTDHPYIDLLRYKSYTAIHYLKDSGVMSDTFLEYTAEVFEALKPFNDFLNATLEHKK